jgi:hypothetical protein
MARQKAIKGKIVAKGPGKWIPGSWWSVRKYADHEGCRCEAREWFWQEGYLQPIDYEVGQTVYFNSKWDDGNLDSNLHLVQEADIFCIVNDNAPNATASVADLPLVQSIDPLARPY